MRATKTMTATTTMTATKTAKATIRVALFSYPTTRVAWDGYLVPMWDGVVVRRGKAILRVLTDALAKDGFDYAVREDDDGFLAAVYDGGRKVGFIASEEPQPFGGVEDAR